MSDFRALADQLNQTVLDRLGDDAVIMLASGSLLPVRGRLHTPEDTRQPWVIDGADRSIRQPLFDCLPTSILGVQPGDTLQALGITYTITGEAPGVDGMVSLLLSIY